MVVVGQVGLYSGAQKFVNPGIKNKYEKFNQAICDSNEKELENSMYPKNTCLSTAPFWSPIHIRKENCQNVKNRGCKSKWIIAVAT